MRKCFSCQENAPKSVKDLLILHKKIHEKTGEVFFFFKENKEGKVKIADAKSFTKILERIIDVAGAEWCHIAEFGTSKNDNVFGDSKNIKPKTTKRKSKPKRTRKPLE